MATLKDLPDHGRVIAKFLASLSPKERLAGLAPEERLAGLAPEERLAGLAPEELVAGLKQRDLDKVAKALRRRLSPKLASELTDREPTRGRSSRAGPVRRGRKH